MKIETPAEGIMKVHDWGNSKVYKIVCGCGQPDHDHDVWVEADDAGVNVQIFVTSKSDCWSEAVKPKYDIDSVWLQEFEWFWKSIVNDIWRRLKLTWTIWSKGYIETETTVTMTEQQSLNYAEALKSAIIDVKNFRKKDEQNKNS